MPVTITPAQVAAANRIGTTTEELAEVGRLLTYATTEIERYLGAAYALTSEAVVNEAARAIVGYIYDSPHASRGAAFANAVRNSGAGRMLLGYRVHRLGSTGDAVAAAQEALGSVENPVVGVAVDAGALVVTLADGSVTREDLPTGGDGIDESARTAAQEAQAAADAAQATADEKQDALMPPSPAEAQNGAATAIRGWSAQLIRVLVEAAVPQWARDATTPVPLAKVAGVIDSHGAVVNVRDGRLPGPPVAMRLGWNQSRTMSAAVFTRASLHPIDGAALGTTSGMTVPPFPPALDTDATLYLGLWLAGDPLVEDIAGGVAFTGKTALTVNGVAGHFRTSTLRLPQSVVGATIRVVTGGARILTEDDLAGLGGGTPGTTHTYAFDTTSPTFVATGITVPTGKPLMYVSARDFEWDHDTQAIDRTYERTASATVDIPELETATARATGDDAVTNPEAATDDHRGAVFRLGNFDVQLIMDSARQLLIGFPSAAANSRLSGTLVVKV